MLGDENMKNSLQQVVDEKIANINILLIRRMNYLFKIN